MELLHNLPDLDVTLVKNNEVTIAQAASYDKIIISPGPATPSESGNILTILKELSPTHSMLGICLGHQAIAETFGAKLMQLKKPYHGFQTQLHVIDDHHLFNNLPPSFKIGLYHSWVVREETLGADLLATAVSEDDYVMAIKHKTYDVHGVQFHPESYMTEGGLTIIKNWLNISI